MYIEAEQSVSDAAALELHPTCSKERMRRGRSNVPSTRLPLYLALSRRFVLECDDGHHNPAGTPNK